MIEVVVMREIGKRETAKTLSRMQRTNMGVFSDDDFTALLALNFFVIAEMVCPQVVLVHERLSADGADNTDTVFERFFVDPTKVFF